MNFWQVSLSLLILASLGVNCYFIATRSPRWLVRSAWREAYRRGYTAGKHRERSKQIKLHRAELHAVDRTHMPRQDSNSPARVSNIQIHRGNQLP